MVVHREDDNDNDKEGQDVKGDHDLAESIEHEAAPDVDSGCDNKDEIADEASVPSLNGVAWIGELGHAEDEVCSNEAIRRAC